MAVVTSAMTASILKIRGALAIGRRVIAADTAKMGESAEFLRHAEVGFQQFPDGNHSPRRVSTVLSWIIFTKSVNSCSPNSETAM